jgi:hypothetical protein
VVQAAHLVGACGLGAVWVCRVAHQVVPCGSFGAPLCDGAGSWLCCLVGSWVRTCCGSVLCLGGLSWVPQVAALDLIFSVCCQHGANLLPCCAQRIVVALLRTDCGCLDAGYACGAGCCLQGIALWCPMVSRRGHSIPTKTGSSQGAPCNQSTLAMTIMYVDACKLNSLPGVAMAYFIHVVGVDLVITTC